MTGKKKNNSVKKYVRTDFRYRDEEHRKLIADAAEFAGLSVNAWLVSRTLEAARRDLAKKALGMKL